MSKVTDHERNDRIEATVMIAGLASLGVLVALAVSTSVSSVNQGGLQASNAPPTAETALAPAGIAPEVAAAPEAEMR